MPRKVGIPAEKIIELHNKGLYDREIAEILGCERSNITIRLHLLGYASNRHTKKDDIELRNRISNSLVGRYTSKNNPNYSGGESVKQQVRGILKTINKRILRNRDNACCACGATDTKLQTHHIKPFKIILDEFLETTYNGDQDTLYEQVVNYPDFMDEENIVILCKQCHYKVHYSDNPELSPFRWESATTISEESTM